MKTINFNDLIGMHLFDGSTDFIVVKKHYNDVVVDIADFDAEKGEAIRTGSQKIITKSELEKACENDLYNERVKIIMGFDKE